MCYHLSFHLGRGRRFGFHVPALDFWDALDQLYARFPQANEVINHGTY